MAEMEVSESFTVCVPDMTIYADTSTGSVTLIMCPCDTDSVDGVKIYNKHGKSIIYIIPDTNGGETKVNLRDKEQYCNSFIIKKERVLPIVMKYEHKSRTWMRHSSSSS